MAILYCDQSGVPSLSVQSVQFVLLVLLVQFVRLVLLCNLVTYHVKRSPFNTNITASYEMCE